MTECNITSHPGHNAERQHGHTAKNRDCSTNEEHEQAANVPRPADIPDEPLVDDPRNIWVVKYGMTHHADLYTSRQLTALATLSNLVTEARPRIRVDTSDSQYADAVSTYLALAASKAAVFHCTQARWRPDADKTAPGFGRQAIPMVWDFAEVSPFAGAGGDWLGIVQGCAGVLDRIPAVGKANASQLDAAKIDGDGLLATDPPYYDNVAYANLSDFFYVWLRRTLGTIFPELM